MSTFGFTSDAVKVHWMKQKYECISKKLERQKNTHREQVATTDDVINVKCHCIGMNITKFCQILLEYEIIYAKYWSIHEYNQLYIYIL